MPLIFRSIPIFSDVATTQMLANIHFAPFGYLFACTLGNRFVNATSPTAIAGQHFKFQFAQIHPLNLLMHAFNFIGTFIEIQVIYKIYHFRMLLCG